MKSASSEQLVQTMVRSKGIEAPGVGRLASRLRVCRLINDALLQLQDLYVSVSFPSNIQPFSILAFTAQHQGL